MTSRPTDVVCIGNAIVDIIARTDDAFLKANSLDKGVMRLTSPEEADRLYAGMGPAVEISGGSGANTAHGISSFGAKAAFIGKVANDQFGQVFRHDMRASGVQFDTADATGGNATARSFILVTPDGERTMNTVLGACLELTPADIPAPLIEGAKIVYLEGYLFDPPEAKLAFHKAAEIARKSGAKVALTLSDGFCVDRYRAEFLDLIRTRVDILFANVAEISALYQTSFEAACDAVRNDVPLAAVTRSAKGSLALTKNQVVEIPAAHVEKIVDTTGAGDLYAAGFLTGLARGVSTAAAGRLASIAAAEVISHLGARPEVSLAKLSGA